LQAGGVREFARKAPTASPATTVQIVGKRHGHLEDSIQVHLAVAFTALASIAVHQRAALWRV